MKKFLFILSGWLTIPHIMVYTFSKHKEVIKKDIARWGECTQSHPLGGGNKISLLVWLLLFYPEFRNVFYLRVGKINYLLRYLPPLSSLKIWMDSDNFGAGTYIQHGIATIITAQSIGENCWINQQVTIGFNSSHKYGYGSPTIGNNVRISAGAKVIGNIKVGDNSIIGVNAVVVKNVAPNSTVIPSPMMLIRENGDKVNKKL